MNLREQLAIAASLQNNQKLAEILNTAAMQLEEAVNLLGQHRNSPIDMAFVRLHTKPASPLPPDERRTLVHTLTGSKRLGVYRNHIIVNRLSPEHDAVRALAERGLMYRGKRIAQKPLLTYCFHCSAAGAAAVNMPLPDPDAHIEAADELEIK